MAKRLPGNRNKAIRDLKVENEIQKLLLSAEFGASFTQLQEMPPELENLFLRHIREYETKMNGAEEISIYEFIGRPVFQPEFGLTDAAVHSEMKRLMNLLREKGIELIFEKEYRERECYRFITEEFFQHKIFNADIRGMTRVFSYEEFKENGSQ